MRVTRNPKSGAMWFVLRQGGGCAIEEAGGQAE